MLIFFIFYFQAASPKRERGKRCWIFCCFVSWPIFWSTSIWKSTSAHKTRKYRTKILSTYRALFWGDSISPSESWYWTKVLDFASFLNVFDLLISWNLFEPIIWFLRVKYETDIIFIFRSEASGFCIHKTRKKRKTKIWKKRPTFSPWSLLDFSSVFVFFRWNFSTAGNFGL